MCPLRNTVRAQPTRGSRHLGLVPLLLPGLRQGRPSGALPPDLRPVQPTFPDPYPLAALLQPRLPYTAPA
jgi:hypothetical protein